MFACTTKDCRVMHVNTLNFRTFVTVGMNGAECMMITQRQPENLFQTVNSVLSDVSAAVTPWQQSTADVLRCRSVSTGLSPRCTLFICFLNHLQTSACSDLPSANGLTFCCWSIRRIIMASGHMSCFSVTHSLKTNTMSHTHHIPSASGRVGPTCCRGSGRMQQSVVAGGDAAPTNPPDITSTTWFNHTLHTLQHIYRRVSLRHGQDKYKYMFIFGFTCRVI